MTKKQFIHIINEIKKSNEFQEKLYKLHYQYGLSSPDINTLQDELIRVLSMYFHNKEDIGYFIYDLNFGKNYKPGMITEADGTEIDLSTAEKLYDYLTRNKGKN